MHNWDLLFCFYSWESALVKTCCMLSFQFPVNSFWHSKNYHINMLESLHLSVESVMICMVDTVVKREWTKNRFFIFTLNPTHKLGKAEHEEKSWHTCSLQKLYFLPVYSSVLFLNPLTCIIAEWHMITNLPWIALSSLGHSGRKWVDIYPHVMKQVPENLCR